MSKSTPIHRVLLALLVFGLTAAASADDMAEMIKSLDSGDLKQMELALEAIADMGSDAAEAVPALQKLLPHENALIQAHAAHALGRIGKPALPAIEALAKMITDEDDEVRIAALDALAAIEPGPETAVPLMISALTSEDTNIVLRALNSLADRGEAIVPAMILALGDERTEYWALLVVQEIGPAAAAAVPAVEKLLGNKAEPELRMEAAMTLGKIGEASASAMPTLISLLEDPEKGVRHAVVFALGSIGPAAKPAVPKLRGNLDSDDVFERTASAWALARIYPDNPLVKERAAIFLVEMLKDDEREVRQVAARSLLDLKPGPKIMVPAFAELMQHSDEGVVNDALDAIASLGADAVPGLIRALAYPKIRMRVADILQRIGEDAAPAVPELIKAFEAEERTEVRREILFAIAHIGPAAVDAVAIGVKGTDDEDEGTRYAAFFALGKIGPPAMAAKAALKEHLENKDWYYSAAAAWALARIDEDDPDVVAKAIPLFLKGLESKEPFVRHEACCSLAKMGPLAAEALPALEKAALDKDKSVSEAATAAIKAIKGE